MLYVFVDIAFDVQHLIMTLEKNFPTSTRFALVSTIQFITSLHVCWLRPDNGLTVCWSMIRIIGWILMWPFDLHECLMSTWVKWIDWLLDWLIARMIDSVVIDRWIDWFGWFLSRWIFFFTVPRRGIADQRLFHTDSSVASLVTGRNPRLHGAKNQRRGRSAVCGWWKISPGSRHDRQSPFTSV